MFDFIGDFLREEGFKPQEIEGRKALVFGFLTDDFRWRVVADANEQDGQRRCHTRQKSRSTRILRHVWSSSQR